MSERTVRFVGEFDDIELTQGLNRAKTAMNSLTTNIEPISLFDAATLQDLDKLETSTNAMEQSINGLDSASTGLSGTFEEIGNAANQAGDNFNAMGTSGETMEQQLAAIGTTSTTAGQSMQALGADVDTTGTSMGALSSAFEETTGTSATLMQGLDDSTKSFKGLGEEAEGTGSTLKDMFSKGGSIAVGISATISGIANLVRGFRDYGDAQLKVEKTTRTLGVQQLAAKDLQQKYNEAVAKYGPNSAEAAKAGEKYRLKLDQINNTEQQLEIQTRHVGDAQLNMWLGLAGTVTGIGGSITQVLTSIGGEKGLAGLATKLAPLKNAFTTFGSGVVTALSGIGGALTIVGGGIVLAMHLLDQDTKTMQAFSAAGIKLTTVQQDSNKAFAEMQAIMRVTHMSMLQIIEDPAKAAATYKELGGQVSATGEIVAQTNDQWDSAHSGIQILFDTIAKGIGNLIDMATGTDKAAESVKKATTAYQDYIPTVIHLRESSRDVWGEQGRVTESYVMGARAVSMYGVESQKTNKTILDNYDAFKKATQAQGPFTSATEKSRGAVHNAAIGIGEAAFNLLSFDDKLKYLSQQGMPIATNATNTYADALSAGNVKFQDLEQSVKDGIITEQRYREQLLLNIKDSATRANAINLTTDELEQQYKLEQGSTEAIKLHNKQLEEAAKKQRELRDAMAESVGAFSEFTGALTKEDFGKAWDEFKASMKDLIPKETINNVKQFFQDLQTNVQGLGRVSKAIDVLFAAITTGTDKLSSTDLKGIIGGMSNELERMAAINPRAAAVNKLLFEPLQKLNGAALTSKIAEIGDAIMIAKTAMDKGWITADAYTDIVNSLATSSGKVATPLGKIGTAADKASGGLNKTGTEGATAAPKLDLVAEALNSVILAGEDVGRRMSALKFNFPAPDLSQFAQALKDTFLAAQQTAAKITALKPVLTITGNNKQALAAINAVVNAQGKIKNILQVIKGDNRDALNKINQVVNAQGKIKNITQTITTVYRTVGSPVRSAHNITGIRAHNITGGGEAGAISVAPLIGGGSSTNTNMSNFNAAGTGDVNVTIINRDEFGTEKIRKYKAVLGKDRYVFGTVGAGG